MMIMGHSWRGLGAAAYAVAAAMALVGCGGEEGLGTSGGTGSGATGSGGGAGSTSGSTTSGTGGSAELDDLLAALRADRDGTLRSVAGGAGWPVSTDKGWLFVSADPQLTNLAGDHDQWQPEGMMLDQGFAWIAEPAIPENDHYKFTDGTVYAADPWSRSVDYDQYGEISIAQATGKRLDRWFGVGDAKVEGRTVRVWVSGKPAARVLYVQDGQNLFDPGAIWGGWHLQDGAPEDMLLVGVDNTLARMDEYTQVPDVIGGQMTGGKGDDYADFLQNTVRPLIRDRYGEPGPVGVMGSSLGGLISFDIADRYPDEYAFAASMSGTMGWGSIGGGVHNQTMIERYFAHKHQKPVLYLDSGGDGVTCADSDADGINDDDPNATDNYCENAQMKDTLLGVGYVEQTDLFYWHEPGATHDEAEWAARVFRPLQVFGAL